MFIIVKTAHALDWGLKMKTDPTEFGICPNCGSPEYMEDYPVAGKRVCIKCGHEDVKVKLKIIETEKEILDNCPFCGKEGEEDDTLFEKDDIIVFRCKKCGKLDGYKFFDFSGGGYDYDDVKYDSLSAKIAKQEGRFICSASRYKEFEKALRKRERDPVEKYKKRLNLLIDEKNEEMKVAGISYETVGKPLPSRIDVVETFGTKIITKITILTGNKLIDNEKKPESRRFSLF